MGAIDSFVEKANNFIRDIYYYIIPGTLLLLTLVTLGRYWFPNYNNLFSKNVANYSFFTSICLLLSVYILGQLLYTISTPLFKVYSFLFQWTDSSKAVKIKREFFNTCQGNYVQDSLANKKNLASLDKGWQCSDSHIYFEMLCFNSKNDIHRAFIERQNTMKYLKRMLSTCFFVIALLLVGFCCSVDILKPYVFLVIFSLMLSFIFSFLFFWDYLNAEVMFLDRVLLCFLSAQDDGKPVDLINNSERKSEKQADTALPAETGQ